MTRSTSWEMDRYARGGAVFGTDFSPNGDRSCRGQGRIAFMKRSTSRQWQGYMNGAVESGARAARDIETMRLMQEVPSTDT